MNKNIALLATGDEIVGGDILNTNTREIAQRLLNANMIVSTHMAVSDHQPDIVSALRHLQDQHSVVIVMGGLGPTVDDRTRFAVSELCGEELIFHQASWEHIQQIFQTLDKPVTESNRQQCYFPETASVIVNGHGTANAFRFDGRGTTFFLLPGPPRECLPIVDQVVLPQLSEMGYASPCCRANYLLMGVGESEIADKIQPYCDACTDVQLGYRVCFPYVQVKLSSAQQEHLDVLQQTIEPILAPYLMSKEDQTASEQLKAWLARSPVQLTIVDEVTYGRWQSSITTAATAHQLSFDGCSVPVCEIQLTGSNVFAVDVSDRVSFDLSCQIQGEVFSFHHQMLSRGARTLDWVVEWASWKIVNCVKEPI